MSEAPDNEAKVPGRPVGEILADIERERSALGDSFSSLRGDLDEALAAGKQRARAAGRKAAVIGPVVAGIVASAAAGIVLYRRRSRRER